ncbi:hypothetical protein [Streptomyces sp. NPDC056672]|uniref:hypothetical protein n=1 Tax=Streptomyces sp. NPDC056672 TaxID=3345906 RepID=UPI00367717B9
MSESEDIPEPPPNDGRGAWCEVYGAVADRTRNTRDPRDPRRVRRGADTRPGQPSGPGIYRLPRGRPGIVTHPVARRHSADAARTRGHADAWTRGHAGTRGAARGAPATVPATGTILELTWERVTPVYRQSGYLWALDEIPPPTRVPPQERAGTRRSASPNWSAGAGEGLRIGLWSWFVTGQVALPWTTAVRQDP